MQVYIYIYMSPCICECELRFIIILEFITILRNQDHCVAPVMVLIGTCMAQTVLLSSFLRNFLLLKFLVLQAPPFHHPNHVQQLLLIFQKINKIVVYLNKITRNLNLNT